MSEQGQAGWKNCPDHRSQHWHWEGDGSGHGPPRSDLPVLFIYFITSVLIVVVPNVWHFIGVWKKVLRVHS